MKKALILLILLSAQMIFAVVDTRLVYVSNARDFPSPGLSTLVFDVEAISNSGNVQINVFQDAVQLDATFRAQNPTVSFSNQLFPLSDYNTTQDYRASDGRIRYTYTFTSGTRSTINNTYTRIVTISIQYTTGSSNGSIIWFTGLPNYTVADLNNQIITGIELAIPAELGIIPLPVELSAFNAKYDEKGKVDLNWVTKTEVSNYGFYVERRINEDEWTSIAFIEGHGNSNSPKQYSYTDNDLFAGGSKFQYRLKQVDTDGQFEYSDVVEVEIVPTKFELSQNYPNPFNPSTTIRFSLPKETSLKINIYNMLGELVETLAEGTYEAGYHKATLNASSLPSGAYVYRIESSEFTQVRKMVLIK
ncbi:MAG: T9SS type A sorting domain-containing protein [Ignavibacteriaceae bacterium]|nr:T9SS type A sorting domain-containing protein [Ignavibacteriaceae bacterium]